MTLPVSRRSAMIAFAGSGVLVNPLLAVAGFSWLSERQVATNTYPWLTFARRSGQAFEIHSDELLKSIASTGMTGYEPIINSADEFDGLAARLTSHGLLMRSIYVNSILHDEKQLSTSIDDVLAIGVSAKKAGVEIVVTNPSPIQWGGTEDKTDVQLQRQAEALNELGRRLRELGLVLAYHNHDAELRQGAREFHHMLTATDDDNVRFCLDSHWVYRGCGNSQIAVFDAVTHYADRIVELHLRQSKNGVWTETFQLAGDIDYRRLFDVLDQKGIDPYFVLEQAVEKQTPNTMAAEESHRISYQGLKAVM